MSNLMILKDVKTFLEKNLSPAPYATISLDVMPFDNDAIMLRNDPASSKTTTYFNKSSIGIMNFSVYARSKNGNTAYEQVEAITKLLDIPKPISITDDKKLFIKCESVTSITMVDYDEQGWYTYFGALTMEYTRSR